MDVCPSSAVTAIQPQTCSLTWTSGCRFLHSTGSRTRSSITALPTPAPELNAYDEFLAILDDGAQCQQLSALAVEEAGDSQLCTRIAELGKEFEAGLLALLFDDPELRRWVRDYLILLSGPVQTGKAFRIAP